MYDPRESQLKGVRMALLATGAVMIVISGGTIFHLARHGETEPIPLIMAADVGTLLLVSLVCLLIMRFQNTDLIREVRHTAHEKWHFYDLTLAFSYEWVDMLRWADHLVDMDLHQLLSVKTSDANGDKSELLAQAEQALQHGGKLSDTPELVQEQASLLVMGKSWAFDGPLGVGWITNDMIFRVISPIEDEQRVLAYAEALLTGHEVNV